MTDDINTTALKIHCHLILKDGSVLEQSVVNDADFQKPSERHWLHVQGHASVSELSRLLSQYQLHPLVLEDMCSKTQRAKIEEYEQYVFVVLRSSMFSSNQLKTQLLYLIVAPDFFISYHPKNLLITPTLLQRLEQHPIWHSQPGFDYLLYLHLDCWVDVLMNHVDDLNNKVDRLENNILQDTQIDILPKLHRMKHDTSRLLRSMIPLRDVLSALMRNDYQLLSSLQHSWYLRDTYDHCLQLMENLDFSRDALIGMIEVSLAAQSNRLNQQMRLLTALSMIFMPMTVLTGIYGMNFDYMPELHWRYGYFMVLGLMAFISIVSIVLLNRRKWL